MVTRNDIDMAVLDGLPQGQSILVEGGEMKAKPGTGQFLKTKITNVKC